MGDVLWMEPIIRQLASKYSKVLVHTKFNALFENYPLPNVVFKDRLNVFEKILYRFEDLINVNFLTINLDMSYERDPKRPILHAYESKAGLPLVSEYPRIYLSEPEKAFPEDMPEKYVILHIESFTRNFRQVFGIDWPTIISFISKLGFTVVQIGKDPVPIQGSIIKKPTIREMIKLIKHAQFFVGIDSGPSHIAASLQIPSLIFFGSVNPLYRHFVESFNGFFLQQFCEFAGCYHETVGQNGMTCRLVGDEGVPKCSLHSNSYVIQQIDLLIKTYL
jgi:ADP-heptose:LPS heptosyltransferase